MKQEMSQGVCEGLVDLVDMYGEQAVSVEIDCRVKKKGYTPAFLDFWHKLCLRDKHVLLTQFDAVWAEMVGSYDHRLLSRLEMHSA